MQKLNILVSNDDCVEAEGIFALVQELSKIGNVTVVAPSKPQSGKGHATTFDSNVEIKEYEVANAYQAFEVDGTPRDCVAFALSGLVDTKFDLVVSGINQGRNIASDCVVSGTCGAACCGYIYGVPSIATSLDHGPSYDYTDAARITKDLALWFLKQPFNKEFVLNINVPNRPYEQIKGFKIVKYGVTHSYHKGMSFRREDDYIISDLRAGGHTVNEVYHEGLDYDEYALSNGYVTLMPMDVDLTKYESLDKLEKAFNNEPTKL